LSINRKDFLVNGVITFAGIGLGFSKPEILEQISSKKIIKDDGISVTDLAKDELYWRKISSLYQLTKDYFHFNHGAVSPQNSDVLNSFFEKYKFSNRGPGRQMWQILNQERESLREELAYLLGAEKEEIAINRNTTEGLANIIFGLDLKRGDEVVLSQYDYPFMVNMWKQREKRDGIKINWVELEFPEENVENIVSKYQNAISAKTKIVHLSHIMNWTGQILPVKEIIKMAHQKGCEVIVDGAHSVGHIDFNLKEMDCDYFATSLHKWLCAPFGTGVLYMKKEKIANIWALSSCYESQTNDIRKFEQIGTRSIPAEMAVKDAIDIHTEIGIKLKTERFQYLKNEIIARLEKIKGIVIYSSKKEEFGSGMVTFGLEQINNKELYVELFNKFKIHSSPVNIGYLNAVRVSPHLFTPISEIEYLCDSIKKIALNN
jgi:selenocysteine lyase/cysteine desulfurase